MRLDRSSVAAAAWIALAATSSTAWAQEDSLARGELLFNIGGCTNCHTAKEGDLLGGGEAIKSPFGDFYAPNISSDPDHGIGAWSTEEFIRAMREGRSPTGAPYYPAFPYTSYTLMSDQDLGAIKAYIDTLPASQAQAPGHDLWFPFNIRWGLYLWQWLFFEPARFEPDPQQSEAWNRGAYLVEGPGHCAECHVPRTFYGVLQRDRGFVGTSLAGEAMPNISSDPAEGIGEWSSSDLQFLLTIGMTPEGDFVGSDMAKVVNNGTSKLPPEDVAAMVDYLETLPPRGSE